jgi:hypothetical protein
MPLSAADIKAFETLANDPEDLRVLVERLKRHPEHKDHPILKMRETEEKMLSPLQEKIDALEIKIKERENSDFYERNRASLRAKGWSNDNIAKLEKRMTDEKDFPVFHNYVQAAEYVQRMDAPLSPSTVSPIFNLAGQPMTNDSSGWREDMMSDDKTKNPLMMNRRQRKIDGRRRWEEAKNDELNKIQGRIS